MRKINNNDIKEIVKAIISSLNFNYNVLYTENIYKFIDSKSFEDRKCLGITFNIEEKGSDKSGLSPENPGFLISRFEDYYLFTFFNVEIYVKFFDNNYQISYNNFYWEDFDSISIVSALEFVISNYKEYYLYKKQKQDSISFFNYIKKFEHYEKIQDIIEY